MLGKRFLLAALTGFAPLAHAQLGIYADFTGDRLSGLNTSPRDFAGVAYNSSVNPTGGTFGAFYDFRNFGPARLGVDARYVHNSDTRSAQTNSVSAGTHLSSALGGVRASFHTPVKLLVPYAQISAGLGRSDYGIVLVANSTTGRITAQSVNNFEYHVYGGVDYNLLPMVSWRIVELGYGGLDAFGTYSHNYPIASVSTGIVFRFGGN